MYVFWGFAETLTSLQGHVGAHGLRRAIGSVDRDGLCHLAEFGREGLAVVALETKLFSVIGLGVNPATHAPDSSEGDRKGALERYAERWFSSLKDSISSIDSAPQSPPEPSERQSKNEAVGPE